jgi:hypothetical protein
MGAFPKAGRYSCDWLDNRGYKSLDRIDPDMAEIGIGSVFSGPARCDRLLRPHRFRAEPLSAAGRSRT